MRALALCLILMGLLAGCTPTTVRFVDDGREVTRIEVHKGARMLFLLHDREILAQYPFELGFAPEGHKTTQGDGRTPEGRYYIDRRNPNSAFYLSIGISYPNAADRAQARARGVDPGGDIFIHGTTWPFNGMDDWTAGCIAVSNTHMYEIYNAVSNGTVIDIYP